MSFPCPGSAPQPAPIIPATAATTTVILVTSATSSASSAISANPAVASKKRFDFGPQLNITIWIMSGSASLFLALRLYCKLWRKRQLWWDDWILIASWVALITACSLQSYSVSLGFGKVNNGTNTILIGITAGFFSILAALWSKISFAVTMLRLTDGRTNRFVWFIIGTAILILGASATIQWVQCSPIQRQWIGNSEGTCWPRYVVINFNIFVASYSGAMDIVLAMIPWKIIWGLKMSRKEKIGVLFAMSMGILAGIISIVKIMTLFSIGSKDNSASINLHIFGVAEGAFSIIACSVPILRALIRSPRDKLGATDNNTFYKGLGLRSAATIEKDDDPYHFHRRRSRKTLVLQAMGSTSEKQY